MRYYFLESPGALIWKIILTFKQMFPHVQNKEAILASLYKFGNEQVDTFVNDHEKEKMIVEAGRLLAKSEKKTNETHSPNSPCCSPEQEESQPPGPEIVFNKQLHDKFILILQKFEIYTKNSTYLEASSFHIGERETSRGAFPPTHTGFTFKDCYFLLYKTDASCHNVEYSLQLCLHPSGRSMSNWNKQGTPLFTFQYSTEDTRIPLHHPWEYVRTTRSYQSSK
jgi:hypothetical protein